MGIGRSAMSFLSQYAAAIPGVLVSLIIPAFVDSISSGIISLLINFLWRGFCKGMVLLKAQCFKIVTGCKSCEDYRVYAHQMWTGPNTNDVLSAAPNTSALGHVRSDYWPLLDGGGPNARVIGRLQGQHIASDPSTWYGSYNILFHDDRFQGSTLVVRGLWVPESPFEWAILGGTGELTLAQGIVYGKTVHHDPNNDRLIELRIHVFYRPINKPN